MKTPLEFQYDNLVIGASLEAILFAFYNKFKFIYTRRLMPLGIDKIEDYGQGTNKLDIWNRHMFQLSLSGYNPFDNKVRHIRYRDENTLKVILHNETVYTVKFNKLYVFDDDNFFDLPPYIKSTSKEYRIVDQLKTKNVKRHNLESVQNKTKFMNQIIFEPRNSAYNTNNIYVVSYVKKHELDNIPESLVLVKTRSFLQEQDIKLITNNKTVNIEHVNRHVVDLGANLYEDFDNVVFAYSDPKIIYMMNRYRVKIDYMKYLRIKLGVAENDRNEW